MFQNEKKVCDIFCLERVRNEENEEEKKRTNYMNNNNNEKNKILKINAHNEKSSKTKHNRLVPPSLSSLFLCGAIRWRKSRRPPSSE